MKKQRKSFHNDLQVFAIFFILFCLFYRREKAIMMKLLSTMVGGLTSLPRSFGESVYGRERGVSCVGRIADSPILSIMPATVRWTSSMAKNNSIDRKSTRLNSSH